MFALYLGFVALLAAGQSGIPRYVQGQWIIPDESLQYEDIDGVVVEEKIWPASPPGIAELVTVDKNLLTTPEPNVMKEQDSDEGESAVWKIVLVAAILLVSVVGSLSMAYYMCVWRGGRFYYQPQKQVYA